MNHQPTSIVCFNRMLIASLCLSFGVIATSLAASDPTMPSPQIRSQLEKENPSTDPGPETTMPGNTNSHVLTLKGMILRDPDHGTAIIALNEKQVCVVSLHRDKLSTGQTLAKLGETILTVTGFTDTSVQLQSLDGRQQFVVKSVTNENAHVSF